MARHDGRRKLVLVDDDVPVLPGTGSTDYVRYMRTDELLALQRPADQRVHADELLFQVTHQSSELWLKLAGAELERTALMVEQGAVGDAELLMSRATTVMRLITDQLTILRHLTPADFAGIRPALGNGSGAQSPGWRTVRIEARKVGAAFDTHVHAAGVDLVELYRGAPSAALYRLAEAMIAFDEQVALWRTEHYKIATRIIGHEVVGTRRTPVDSLAQLIAHQLYPQLWQVRTRLTLDGPLGHAGPGRRP